MQSRAFVSVGEYLATSYQPDFEYVDGQLLERNLGERDHSEVQMAVSAYLHNRRRELGIHVSLSKGFRCERLDSAFRISA